GLRTAVELCGLLEKIRHRRRLHLERKGAVLIGRDDERDRDTLLHLLGLRVERLAELHDVETALPKRRPDRGRRIGGAGGHLQFKESSDFLCHRLLRWWCGY